MAMRERRLGRTGLQISELVFGGGWVGGILIHQDDAVKREAIRRAIDGGINFIDTAPGYGDGQSEEALGWLLQEVEPKPYLATKVRLDPASSEAIDAQIEASLAASLKRLQRDDVDLLQLHNPIREDGGDGALGIDQLLGEGGVAEVFERLKQDGATRFVGITALGEPAACRQVIESGRFDTAQIYYNMLNPTAGRSMPAAWSGFDFQNLIGSCKAQDVGVLNIRTFAAGVLATDERHGREVQILPDASMAAEELRAKTLFARLGERYGSRAQTALRFSLSQPDISGVVFGMAELDHLDQALKAAEMGPLPAEALEELEDLYSANFGLA
jgi:L-galactose dehydrogenase/L-glyceraldehyde 3-phosphate reductase